MKAEILTKHGVRIIDLNRRRAIRERCLNCSGWTLKEVEFCSFSDTCSLWPYRMGRGKQNAKARNKAIKSYCLWCMAGNRAEIAKCVSPHCALFLFRSASAQKSLPVSKKAHLEARIEVNKGNAPLDPMGAFKPTERGVNSGLQGA